MSATDTTKAPQQAPWCPRCGGEMVRITPRTRFGEPLWLAQCRGCGFGCDDELSTKADAGAEARRLVRAELARQALEMRAHSSTTRNENHGGSEFTLSETMLMVTNDYEWLGTHPLRLPGEEGS